MNNLRFTGLMSGMDTETTVRQLMRPQQIRVDRITQNKVYAEWQRDSYREIINKIKVFKDDYFNFLNPSSNMRSAGTYNSFNISYNGDNGSEYFSVTAGSSVVEGTHTINNINIAQTAKGKSDSTITAEIIGNELAGEIIIDEDNNRFSLDFNGVRKTIVIDSGTYSGEELKDNLQLKIDQAFGSEKIVVDFTDDKIKISEFSPNNTDYITIRPVTGNNGLSAIGFAEDTNKSNRLMMNAKLADISNSFANGILNTEEGEDISFTINNTEFNFDSSEVNLSQILNIVNNSEANVNIRYNELNDKFEIESRDTGVTAKVDISDNGDSNFMELLGLNNTEESGTDASVEMNGNIITRSSNSFTVNGLNINLTKDYTGDDIALTINSNPSATADKIIDFVEKYNELISHINGKLNEPRDREFQPITDEQKENMSENEIELWEERAKSGILRRDPLLERMLNNMRSALFTSPEGVNVSLFDLGITTSSNNLEGGKLIVDEDKLNQFISENPQGVVELFTQSSDEVNEKGIANRIFDIIEDNIRTTRDNRGRKGLLLEKAGIEGDTTEINNYINRQIIGYDNRINDMLDVMARQEENYFRMFSRMESALSEMYAQSDWLMAQLDNMNQ